LAIGLTFDDGIPRGSLKTFLEMRGADGGPWRRRGAPLALWVGIFYDRWR
jgi:glutamate--cysteine ligase